MAAAWDTSRRRSPRGRDSLFRVLAALTKFRIAALASFSAATGYCVADSGSAAASLGVLLLAMGACALNEGQDGRLDARMARTRSRPLPGVPGHQPLCLDDHGALDRGCPDLKARKIFPQSAQFVVRAG